MSVIICYVRITPAQLDLLQRNPSLVESVLGKEEEEDWPRSFDVDVAWDVIRYMLAGRTADDGLPMASAVDGGTAIGPDLGAGPARYLTPDIVRSLAGALSMMPKGGWKRRFDPAAMRKAKVYSADDWNDFEELYVHIAFLTERLKETAASGDALLVYQA